MKEKYECHRDKQDENLDHLDGVDLPDILTRTVTDLQDINEKLREGLAVYNKYLNLTEASKELEAAKQLVNLGLEMQVSLLNFIKDMCQLFGLQSDVADFKEEEKEPSTLPCVVKAEIEDGFLYSDDDEKDLLLESTHLDVTFQTSEEKLEMQEEDNFDNLSDERTLSCDMCMKTYKTEKGFSEHVKWQHTNKERTFPCQLCEKAFKHKGHLTEHMGWCHSDKKEYNCDLCSKICPSKPSLKRHMRRTHDVRVRVRYKCSENKQDNHNTDLSPKQIIKTENGIKEDSQVSIKEDLSKDNPGPTKTTNVKIEENSMALDGKSLKVKEKRPEKFSATKDENRSTTCEVCGKVVKEACRLREHMAMHSDQRPFACDICGNTYKFKTNVSSHKRAVHDCGVCGKQLANVKEKKQHMISDHPDKPLIPEHKQNICDTCGFTGDKSSLRVHMRIHTGEKLFKCDTCGERFATRYNLKHHVLLHTGEMPYECNVCKRRFRRKSQLKTHYRLHTGEKPYDCNVCGKAFHLANERNKHVRKAHGNSEKPPCKPEI